MKLVVKCCRSHSPLKLSLLQSVHVVWSLSIPAHCFMVGNGSLLTFPQSVHVETPSSAVRMPDAEGDTLRLSLVGTDAVAALCEQFLGTELPGLDDAHTLSLTQQSSVSEGLCVSLGPSEQAIPFSTYPPALVQPAFTLWPVCRVPREVLLL